jgi:hypothetical protein
MNENLLSYVGFSPLNESEMIEVDGGSTKVAAGIAAVIAGGFGVATAVCAAANHSGVAAWCAVGASAAGLVSGILGAIPLP